MDVAQLGEQELIRRMAEVLSSVANPAVSTDVLVGIGDDAALVQWDSPSALLKSDQQVEGVHLALLLCCPIAPLLLRRFIKVVFPVPLAPRINTLGG